jgi:Na+-transporting methylmalonyl-CoA/oxaloacetate decarboxylase gamma subunit
MNDLVFGLQITVVGMGIVFGLLALLWMLLTLVLRLERRGANAAGDDGGTLNPAPPSSNRDPSLPRAGTSAPAGDVRLVGAPADLDPRLVSAIAVAVLRHAETRRRQAAPAMRSYWPGSLLFASRWVASGRARQNRSWTRRAR